jgi:hypothetical protein
VARNSVEMIAGLRFRLQMMGIEVTGPTAMIMSLWSLILLAQKINAKEEAQCDCAYRGNQESRQHIY